MAHLIEALTSIYGYGTVKAGKNLPLKDYLGNIRPEKADIVVPRRFIHPASNDLGFKKNENGVYTMIISEFDEVVASMTPQRLANELNLYGPPYSTQCKGIPNTEIKKQYNLSFIRDFAKKNRWNLSLTDKETHFEVRLKRRVTVSAKARRSAR